MLEVTGGGLSTVYSQAGLDFAAAYAASPLRAANDARLDALAAAGAGAAPSLQLAGHYATRSATQQRWLLWKHARLMWRSTHYVMSRLALTLGASVFMGLLYIHEVCAARPSSNHARIAQPWRFIPGPHAPRLLSPAWHAGPAGGPRVRHLLHHQQHPRHAVHRVHVCRRVRDGRAR